MKGGEPARFQAVVARWVADDQAPDLSLSKQVVSDTVSLAKFSKDIRGLLHSAVQEGTEAASAARARAERAAWVMGAATILLLVLTAAVLVSVSLRIHRRLVGLADQAVRLRAGESTPVTIRGPREVAIVTMALNAAAGVLRQLTRKAENSQSAISTRPSWTT